MSQKKPFIILSLGVLAIATFTSVYFYDLDKAINRQQADGAVMDNASSVEARKNASPLTDYSDREFMPPAPEYSIDKSEMQENLWSTDSGNFRKAPKIYQNLDNRGVDRAYVEVARATFEALEKGDKIDIPIPQLGESYPTKIESVVTHKNGDKTLRGKIQGFGSEYYTVTITQGKRGSFATISTPEGVYVMEASDSTGWIAAKDQLAKQQSREVSDEVIFTPDQGDIPAS